MGGRGRVGRRWGEGLQGGRTRGQDTGETETGASAAGLGVVGVVSVLDGWCGWCGGVVFYTQTVRMPGRYVVVCRPGVRRCLTSVLVGVPAERRVGNGYCGHAASAFRCLVVGMMDGGCIVGPGGGVGWSALRHGWGNMVVRLVVSFWDARHGRPCQCPHSPFQRLGRTGCATVGAVASDVYCCSH